jgi:predicted RNA-binding Zn-ribbon protein involved in translation (DUF1610 family)
MTEDETYPLERGQFTCKACEKVFSVEKKDISFVEGKFLATCPLCGEQVPEIWYMKNCRQTVGSAKGANMSAEARKKTRLNSFTTGSSLMRKGAISKIPLPPAKPEDYPECDACPDIEECKDNVKAREGTGIPVYCHRQAEVLLKFTSAFASGDPESLKFQAAENAARMQMVLNASFLKVFERGVEVVETIFQKNKAGEIQKDILGTPYITEKIYAHPLIKRCIEIMQTMGYTLGDWTMTPKSKEAKEQVAGFLVAAGMAGGSTPDEVVDKLTSAVDKFVSGLQKAKKLREGDATLKAFEEEMGQREAEE